MSLALLLPRGAEALEFLEPVLDEDHLADEVYLLARVCPYGLRIPPAVSAPCSADQRGRTT